MKFKYCWTQPDRHMELMFISVDTGRDSQLPGEGLPAYP